MRALRALPFALAFALTAPAAHAGAPPAEAPPAKASPAEATLTDSEASAVLAYFNELVDTAVKHQGDCGALATGVNGVVDRHQAALELSWAAQKAQRKLPGAVTAQMNKRGIELVGALRACWTDAAVKAAFGRMKPPKSGK